MLAQPNIPPAYRDQHPTPVTVVQTGPLGVHVHPSAEPLPVEIYPHPARTILTVLASVLGLLHAITCLVFLYSVWRINVAMDAIGDGLRQLGGGLGG